MIRIRDGDDRCQCLDHQVSQQDPDQDSKIDGRNDLNAFFPNQNVSNRHDLRDKQQGEKSNCLVVLNNSREHRWLTSNRFSGNVGKNCPCRDQQVSNSKKYQQH